MMKTQATNKLGGRWQALAGTLAGTLARALVVLTCVTAGQLAVGGDARADFLSVTLSNTLQLPSNTGFYLTYENNNGVADNNSVTAANISGLTANGSADTSIGDAAGDLSGSPSFPRVRDTNASELTSEFFQGFDATSNTITFDLLTTLNSVGQGSNGAFDSVSLQLFDITNNVPYSTTAGDDFTLFRVTFDSLNNPSFLTYETDDAAFGTPIAASITVVATPEPETWAMFALGLGLIAWALKRKKQSANQLEDARGPVSV